jgi:3',5'-cyclic AMP phosphodiesterase CpdA
MGKVRIAHFSDIHVALPPTLSTLDINRFFSWGRWVVRRRSHHSLERLERAIDITLESKPDLAICTGDLSHMGQPHELEAVSEMLNRLTENGIPLLLTGGNHDYYNPSAKDEFSRLQEKHGLGIKIDNEGIVRLNGVTVLMLYQSIYNPFYMARGKLDGQTINRLEKRLHSGDLPAIHLAAGHFPINDADGRAISIRKRLEGDDRLKQFLTDNYIPAYLCGHCHKPFTISLSNGCTQYCSGSITNAGVLRFFSYTEGQFVRETQLNLDMDISEQ